MNYGIIRSKGLWYRFPGKVVRSFSFRGRGSAGAAWISETKTQQTKARKENNMNIKTAVAAMSVLASTGAFADFNLNLDLSGKPMRDLSKTTSKAIVGYISAMHEYGDDYWFVSNKCETAAAMKKAGCYNTATWGSDGWFLVLCLEKQ